MYLEYTYRRPRFLASTLVAVQAVILGFTASNCIIFAKYTFFALSVEPTESQHKVLAVGLLTIITIVHGCFLKTGIWVQNVLGWVKIFLIGAMSLTGLWVILLNVFGDTVQAVPGGEESPGLAWDTLWEGSNWSWSLLSTALFKVIYSYAGLSNVNNVLNEVHDPVRTIKTVCPSALITAGGLYLLANFSYLLVVPLDDIKNSGELVGALLFERLFGNHIGKTLFPLAIAISAAGNVMVVTYALVFFLSLFLSFFLFESATILTSPGPSEPRNRPPGISSLVESSFVLSAIRDTSRGSYCALLSIRSSDCPTAPARCL